MSAWRRPLAAALGIVAICLALVVAILWRASLGVGVWCLGLAALSGGASLLLARRPRGAPVDEATRAVLRTIEQEAEELERRELRLSERLLRFHEWLELPLPPPAAVAGRSADTKAEPATNTSLANTSSAGPSERTSQSTSPANSPAPSELAQRDRELKQILDEETEQLYNRIRENIYWRDEQFDAARALADAQALVLRIARVYQPAAQRPMLETSLTLVLRAASRGALQLLVVLDGLPVDVKDLSVNKLYGYVRRAVQAYGTFQTARPYFQWMTGAWYFGRWALGASPLTLAAWFAAGRLGRRGAGAVAARIVDRQALRLIHDVVWLLGNEVAQAYGGDYRRRDPAWIYGAELTALAAQLPASHKLLALGLREIGALELRSEYDRVFLYRCLGSRRSASPERWRAREVLNSGERLEICRRLEKFAKTHVAGADKQLAEWRRELESRLAVKVDGESRQGDATRDALRSLAGFLLDVQSREPGELAGDLSATRLAQVVGESALRELGEDPPFVFEYADVAPGSELANNYLDDLSRLAASRPPRDHSIDELLCEAASYLRESPDAMQARLTRAALDELTRRLESPWRGRARPPLAAARRLLTLTDDGRRLRFAHAATAARPANAVHAGLKKEGAGRPVWLTAVGDQLLAVAEDGEQVWEGLVADTRLTKQAGWLETTWSLDGGRWAGAADSTASNITITQSRLANSEQRLPLLEALWG